MINIIVFKPFYERQKINKIRWIYSKNNLANAMTKKSPNLVLEKLNLINKATIRL